MSQPRTDRSRLHWNEGNSTFGMSPPLVMGGVRIQIDADCATAALKLLEKVIIRDNYPELCMDEDDESLYFPLAYFWLYYRLRHNGHLDPAWNVATPHAVSEAGNGFRTSYHRLFLIPDYRRVVDALIDPRINLGGDYLDEDSDQGQELDLLTGCDGYLFYQSQIYNYVGVLFQHFQQNPATADRPFAALAQQMTRMQIYIESCPASGGDEGKASDGNDGDGDEEEEDEFLDEDDVRGNRDRDERNATMVRTINKIARWALAAAFVEILDSTLIFDVLFWSAHELELRRSRGGSNKIKLSHAFTAVLEKVTCFHALMASPADIVAFTQNLAQLYPAAFEGGTSSAELVSQYFRNLPHGKVETGELEKTVVHPGLGWSLARKLELLERLVRMKVEPDGSTSWVWQVIRLPGPARAAAVRENVNDWMAGIEPAGQDPALDEMNIPLTGPMYD